MKSVTDLIQHNEMVNKAKRQYPYVKTEIVLDVVITKVHAELKNMPEPLPLVRTGQGDGARNLGACANCGDMATLDEYWHCGHCRKLLADGSQATAKARGTGYWHSDHTCTAPSASRGER